MEAASNQRSSELQAEIEQQIEQLQSAAGDNQEALKQLEGLHERVEALRRQISGKLTPWERTELARHPSVRIRWTTSSASFPTSAKSTATAISATIPPWSAAWRVFTAAKWLVLGTQKGRDTKQRVYRNFGQPNPEGYRKALRVMKIAEKWRRPVIALIDVVGAYPGLGAEERGQAEAIAHNLREMARLQSAVHRRHHRRRRQRRRAGHRRRRPRADAWRTASTR